MDLAGAMAALGDRTRLMILFHLAEGELHVQELCERLGCPQPTASHHLGLLRLARMVQSRRAGKGVFYRLGGVAAAPGPDILEFSAGRSHVIIRQDMSGRVA